MHADFIHTSIPRLLLPRYTTTQLHQQTVLWFLVRVMGLCIYVSIVCTVMFPPWHDFLLTYIIHTMDAYMQYNVLTHPHAFWSAFRLCSMYTHNTSTHTCIYVHVCTHTHQKDSITAYYQFQISWWYISTVTAYLNMIISIYNVHAHVCSLMGKEHMESQELLRTQPKALPRLNKDV